MNFETAIQPDEFRRVAKLCASVMSRSVVPIVGHAKFVADGKHLTVEATNLDQVIRLSLPCESRGEFTAPIWRLTAIAPTLGDGDVRIGSDGAQVTVRQGSARHKMPCLDVRGFPHFERQSWKIETTCEAGALKDALGDLVQYRDSGRGARQYLTGVHFNVERHVLESSDGKVLGSNAAPWLAGSFDGAGFIVPGDAVKAITDALSGEMVTVRANAAWAEFDSGNNGAFLTRLLNDIYPETFRLIPKSAPHHWRVNVKALSLALARVMTIGPENWGSTKIKIELGDDAIRLSGAVADNSSAGEAECECERIAGKPQTVYLSSVILRTLLSAIGGAADIDIGMQDGYEMPLLVTPFGASDPVRLAMPMRA